MKKLNIAIYGCAEKTAYAMWQCLEGDHRISPGDSREFPGAAASVDRSLMGVTPKTALYTPLDAIICEFKEFVEIKPYLRDTGEVQNRQGKRIPVLILNSTPILQDEIEKFAEAADVDVTFSDINIPTGRLEDLYFIDNVNLFSTQHEEVFFWYEFLYNTFPNLGEEDEYR